MSTAPIVTTGVNDLYITGYIYDFPKDGESLLLRDKLEFEGDEEDSYHEVTGGDRLDLIAYNAYKNIPNVVSPSKLWWVIADANNIHNPFDLSAYIGKELLVPNYEKFKLKI